MLADSTRIVLDLEKTIVQKLDVKVENLESI